MFLAYLKSKLCISTWKQFSLIYIGCCGFLYICVDILVPLDNYISRSTAHFLACKEPDYQQSLWNMISSVSCSIFIKLSLHWQLLNYSDYVDIICIYVKGLSDTLLLCFYTLLILNFLCFPLFDKDGCISFCFFRVFLLLLSLTSRSWVIKIWTTEILSLLLSSLKWCFITAEDKLITGLNLILGSQLNGCVEPRNHT